MTFELHDNRSRAIGLAAALGVNGLLLALLLTLSRGVMPPALRGPGLSTFDLTLPPPPAPPKARAAAVAAPPSRGAEKAPSPRNEPHPLPRPTPAQPAVDAGSQSASGAGAAAGSGAGQGGQGNGSGAGTGSGMATAPVHIAGTLSDADYARSGVPKGAGGTVVISFRVRSDGAVDRCVPVRSSGYPAIDAATCRLVEKRFRFRPALDSGNHPIDFTLRTDFTWRPR